MEKAGARPRLSTGQDATGIFHRLGAKLFGETVENLGDNVESFRRWFALTWWS